MAKMEERSLLEVDAPVQVMQTAGNQTLPVFPHTQAMTDNYQNDIVNIMQRQNDITALLVQQNLSSVLQLRNIRVRWRSSSLQVFHQSF